MQGPTAGPGRGPTPPLPGLGAVPRAASGVTVIRIGATLACLQSEPPSAASAAASASGTCHDDARPRRNLNDGGNGGDN